MALTATTLAAALTATGLRANLTSATGIVAGSSLIKIDDEFCFVQALSGTWVTLLRGLNGSAQVAHNALAPAVHSTNGGDFSIMPAPRVYSYDADGAITVAPGLHLITKASAAALTLADPATDQMGMVITIASTTAAAHTVTLTTGYLGTADESKFTFANVKGHSVTLVAAKGVWAQMMTSNAADETAGVAVAAP